VRPSKRLWAELFPNQRCAAMTMPWSKCPGCDIVLIVDAPFNILSNWPEILGKYQFQRVGMQGGWENFGLENTVPLEDWNSDSCDAVYVGDLITDDLCCPRCGAPIAAVVRTEPRG
jgi:hypothetical protein